jgi:hypothetical protein
MSAAQVFKTSAGMPLLVNSDSLSSPSVAAAARNCSIGVATA